MKKGVSIIFAILLIGSVAVVSSMLLKKDSKTINYVKDYELIAHRGFNEQFPENTLFAAQQAVKMGANPECDVQFTSDGIMVVIHDAKVDRTTDGTGTVRNLDYAYIEKLDAGSKFSDKYKGLKVPKFIDYLNDVKSAKHIYPELKNFRNTEDIVTFTQTLIDYGFEEKATIQSFDYFEVLSSIRKVSKEIRVGALCSNQNTFDNYVEIAKDDSNSIMLISTKLATIKNLDKCKEDKVDVAVWTVNDESELRKLLEIGYNKFICSKYINISAE